MRAEVTLHLFSFGSEAGERDLSPLTFSRNGLATYKCHWKGGRSWGWGSVTIFFFLAVRHIVNVTCYPKVFNVGM